MLGNRTRTQIVTRNQYTKTQGGASGIRDADRKQITPPTRTQRRSQDEQSRNGATTSKPTTANIQNIVTVFVEPANAEQMVFKHPAEIAKILANIGIAGYKDIRNVGRFRFRISFDSTGEATKVNDKKLQGTGLRKYTPVVKNEIIGIIKDVPRNFEEMEIRDNLDSDQEVTRIERVKRKGRGDELQPTDKVKITFKGKEHPEMVQIYGVPFRVEIYLFPIKQCSNCWMFTHKTKDCKKTKKCGKCGGEQHENQDCGAQPKCINCRGQHPADDRECKERIRQRKIKEAMQKERIPLVEAAERFPKESNRFALLARMDEFPELEDISDDSEDERGTQSGEGKRAAETGRKQHKRGKPISRTTRKENHKRTADETGEEVERHKENENKHGAEIKKLKRRVDRMEKNWKAIGKIVRLQNAVEGELRESKDQLALEGLIIKICTVLKEIVSELGENIDREDHSAEESVDMENE
nr:uncharacterized protein LOC115269947 [Aedes albopictus]